MAIIVGATLALGVATAFAGHTHTTWNWGHGMGAGDDHNSYFHPYMQTTNYDARYSCVGYVHYSYDSPRSCRDADHNHQDVYTYPYDECQFGANVDARGDFVRHNHFHHEGICT